MDGKIGSMTTFKSRVSMIFDETLGEYPVYVLPDQPEEEASAYDRETWKLDRIEYGKQLTKLEEDKLNLYGAILGQMSESSKTRAKEVQLA